jgi:hypothetical protein
MKYEVTVENTKTGNAKKVTVEAADKFEAMAKVETMRWAAVGAQRTVKDIMASRRKAAEMRLTEEGPYLPCSYCGSTFHQPPCPYEPVAPQWMGTEPCYAAETNAHISAFFASNCMRLIESVAAKSGIDLQAEMRKSEAVERNLAEMRRFALLTPCQKVAEFEGYDR